MFLREEEQRAERNLPPNKSPDKTEGYYAEKNVLRKNSDFSAIYKRGKSVGDRYVVLFYRPNGLSYNRTGFLASKKVGNSVKRNRAKRLMKEKL